MRRIRYLTLAMWLIGCISVFAQVGSGFDPANPAEPSTPNLPTMLTVVAEPVGAGNPSPTGKHAVGATVNLRANPATGFRLVRWTNEAGEELSTQASFNIVKQAVDEVITAHYVYEPTGPSEPNDPWLTLSLPLVVVAAEGGNVSGGGRYVPGATATVNASPISNYVFRHWMNQDGEVVSTLARFNHVMRNARDTLTAYFDFLPTTPAEPDAADATPKHHIFTVAGEGGTVSANQYVREGQTVTVSASCNTGYVFLGWYVDGQLYNTNASFTYTMQMADVTFEARFHYNPGAPAEPNFPTSAKKQVFYIENANGFQGETMLLSVFLSSLTDIGDLTFQLSFPAQLVPPLDNITYAEGLAAYTTKTCTPLDATTLRFVFSGGTLRAGNGALVTFHIPVPADYSTGTKNPVRMAQISFNEVGASGTTTANARNGHIGIYKHGDVNGDNDIDLVDIHSVMLFMAGMVEPSDGFIREAADYNKDGDVDEADLARLVSVACESVITAQPVASANALNIPTFQTAPGVTHRYMEGFSVHLNNEADVWGVQFDVLLPDGIHLDLEMPDGKVLEGNAERLGEGMTGFQQITTPLQDGWQRIMLYPTQHDRFIAGFEGELLRVHYLTDAQLPLGDAPIGLRNVVLALQRMDYDRPASEASIAQVVDFIPRPYDATMIIGEAHVATFVAPFDVEIPATVKAYLVDGQDGTQVHTTPVDNLIPANTPVFLYSEEAVDETFSGRLLDRTPVTVGLLTGVFVETEAQAGAYVLKETVDEKPHFRLVESRPVVIAPSRAFIQPKAEISTPVLNIPWEEIVDNLPQISLDKKSSVLYDLQGRRTTAHQPGIYILTGRKKVLLK